MLLLGPVAPELWGPDRESQVWRALGGGASPGPGHSVTPLLATCAVTTLDVPGLALVTVVSPCFFHLLGAEPGLFPSCASQPRGQMEPLRAV